MSKGNLTRVDIKRIQKRVEQVAILDEISRLKEDIQTYAEKFKCSNKHFVRRSLLLLDSLKKIWR